MGNIKINVPDNSNLEDKLAGSYVECFDFRNCIDVVMTSSGTSGLNVWLNGSSYIDHKHGGKDIITKEKGKYLCFEMKYDDMFPPSFTKDNVGWYYINSIAGQGSYKQKKSDGSYDRKYVNSVGYSVQDVEHGVQQYHFAWFFPAYWDDLAWRVKLRIKNHDSAVGNRMTGCYINSDGRIIVQLSGNTIPSGGTNRTGGNSLPQLYNNANHDEIINFSGNTYSLPFSNGARFNARPRYDYNWKAGNPDKDAGFGTTSGGSADEVLTTVDADFYNDVIYIDARNLAKPTGLKRSGKRLSWNAVTDAASYTVRKNGLDYKTTTNTYIDIDDGDYYGLTNTYTVRANDRCWLSFEYIPYTGQFPGYTGTIYNWIDEWVHAYKHSDYSSATAWTNVGYLYAPSVNITKNTLNNFTVNIPTNNSNKITTTIKLKITTGGSSNTYIVSDNKYTIPNMVCAQKYTLDAWFEGGGISSGKTTKTITPVKAPTPVFSTSGTGWTSKRKRANAFQIDFTTSNNDTYSTGNTVDKYNIKLNGIYDVDSNGNPVSILSSHILSGFKCNQSNKITLISVFNADPAYNSEKTYELPAEYTPKLSTPVLTETEIASTTVQEFWETDFGNQEINNKEIIDRLQLDWSQIEFADGYVMYDEERDWDPDNEDWIVELKTTPNQNDGQDGTEISDSRQEIIYASENPGYHKYWVKAVFKDDEEYNSEISNIIEKEQNIILEAPLAEYDPNTTTVKFTKSSFADFYSIQLTPHNATVSNLFRSFTLDLNQNDLTYNFYDMIKDLKATELFDISIIARSYNAFHYRPSNPSNICGQIQVIKLKTPDLAEENAMDDTGLLSWQGDENTFKYHVYIKAIDGEWANYYTSDRIYNEDWTTKVKSPWEYQFYDLAGSLYSFYVIAERDDSLTNQTIPDAYSPSIRAVYLDSEKSAVRSAGLLSQPRNFQRYVNRFSWDDVGDDVQKYVLWDQYEDEEPRSIVTVDGGGVSLELGLSAEDNHRPQEGTHRYQIQAVADIGGRIYYSTLEPWTSVNDPHIIDCEIKYLTEPVASYNPEGTSDFIWTEPDKDAGELVRYDTRVNNEKEADDQHNNTYSLRKDEPGLYYFNVRSISDEDIFLYQTSLFSNKLLYEVYQLPRPSIELSINKDTASDEYGLHTIEWEDIPNATDYAVHIRYIATIEQDGNIIQLDPVDTIRITHDSRYELFPTMEFGVGNFEIYVTSLGSVEENANPKYTESEKSNTVKFGTLATPIIKITDNEISWDNIYLADYYEVINYGDYFSSSDDNRFELDVTREYSYSIQIGAKSTDPNISPSTLSNTIKYDVVKLQVPKNFYLDGRVLHWDVVNNADYYSIWANDEEIILTSNNEYDMTSAFEEMAGVVRLYIRAHSNKMNYLDSDESNYVLKSIAKEQKYNIVIDGKSYNQIQLPFKMNETLDETLDTASMTLAYLDRKEPFQKLTPATLLIYESEMDSRRYRYVIESDKVEEVQYKDTVKYKHVLNLIEPTIILQNEIVPNFTVTKDNIRQLVSHIKVDPDFGGNVIAGQDWAEDNCYVAKGDYFVFNFLEFIEFIGKMFKFILPDLGDDVVNAILDAIRQLFSYIPEDYYEIAFGRLNIMGIGTSILGTLKNEYKSGQAISLPTPSGRLNGYCYNMNPVEAIITDISNSDSVIGGVSSTGQALGSVIQDASDWVDSRWGVFGDVLSTGLEWIGKGVVYVTNPMTAFGDLFSDLMGVDGCTVMDDDWAFPARVYKYRPHSDNYADQGNEIELARTDFSSTLITTTGTISKPGVYDIILEIPAVDFQDLANKGLVDMNPVLGRSDELSGVVVSGIAGIGGAQGAQKLMLKLAKDSKARKMVANIIHKILIVVNPVLALFGVSVLDSAIDVFLDSIFGDDNFITKMARCEWPKDVNFMKTSDRFADFYDYERGTCKYRVVWKNITIKDRAEDEAKSIAWVLNKVMNLTNNKYKIDPAILKLAEGYKCPDLTFSGSNTLYEVLTKLGREFYGIPRLTDERVITFDVLDETCPANRHQKIWRDHNVLCNRQQELDKTATGYIAPISNMILDDDITVFPAPGMWTHARGPEDKAVIDIGEQILTLDKPIYKIEQVLVKNVLKDSPDTVLDITDFVYQDIVYNSLNAAEWGKGRALRWTQGEKTIDGLGQIPEESKLYAALGWKADDYVIQHIIKGMAINDDENWKTFLNDDVNKYMYQITYQGYIDTLSYIENPNKTKQTYQMYKVFNQMDNTISDKRFGDSATIQLKRHGNDIIDKSYITDSVIGMPLLGDYTMIDNEKYYIDEVCYEFENSYIRSHVTFSKNYNKINPRVGVNSEYRQYQLRVDQNVDRTVNFNQYCYVGNRGSTSISNLKAWKDVLMNSMTKQTTLKPDTFYFNCYDNIALDKLSYKTRNDDGGIITERVSGIALPCNMAKLGASIQFSAKMLDSFCAGNSIREIKEDKADMRMEQKFVRYVGDDGGNQVPRMRVTIGSMPNSAKTADMAWTYPSVYWYSQPQVSLVGPIVLSKEIEPLKDQREALNFNYQMHFIANRNDLFIHKGMTKYLFRNVLESKRNVTPVVVAHNANLSMKDTITVYDTIGTVSIKSASSGCEMTLSYNSKSTKNYTGLAVIWPDTKEILFEITRDIKSGNNFTGNNKSSESIFFNFTDKMNYKLFE